MNKLAKFRRLSLADQLFLLRILAAVSIVRLALQVLNFQTVRSVLHRLGNQPDSVERIPDMQQVARIIWAVNLTSDYLFSQRPCLTKALVAQMLLARAAYPTTLRVGVQKSPDRQLRAHAWLERDGVIVIGQLPNLKTFVPLPALEWKQS